MMGMTLPNILTLARIAAIPIFVIAYLALPNQSWIAALVFLLAAITDWLDGFLARRMNIESPFGAFLDPVADKLVVCTALVLLVANQRLAGQLVTEIGFVVAVIVIIGREVSVVALREWMADAGNLSSVATSAMSKVKTTVQMIAIILLLIAEPYAWFPTLFWGEMMLYLATILTIWSAVLYLKVAWPLVSK